MIYISSHSWRFIHSIPIPNSTYSTTYSDKFDGLLTRHQHQQVGMFSTEVLFFFVENENANNNLLSSAVWNFASLGNWVNSTELHFTFSEFHLARKQLAQYFCFPFHVTSHKIGPIFTLNFHWDPTHQTRFCQSVVRGKKEIFLRPVILQWNI